MGAALLLLSCITTDFRPANKALRNPDEAERGNVVVMSLLSLALKLVKPS